MKISELIEQLKQIQDKKGDLKVYIQCRDDAGCYCGLEDDFVPCIDDNPSGKKDDEDIVVL